MTNSFSDLSKMLLEDYKKLPRDEKKMSTEEMENKKAEIRQRLMEDSVPDADTHRSTEQMAVQDMRELLDFVEKKVTGKLTEQEKGQIEQKAEQWQKSIAILRESILK